MVLMRYFPYPLFFIGAAFFNTGSALI